MSESGQGLRKNVLLAIDGSIHSERALNFYLEHLQKPGQTVHLVQALEYPYLPTQPYVREEIVKELFQRARTEAEAVSKKFTSVLQQKQIEYKVHMEFTNPGEYICKVAKENDVIMICLGTRGLGTIRRTIMGSVSDYVVHHAHCPVMIAREPKAKEVKE